MLRALGGRGDEQLRRGYGFPSGAVVFPDPGLVVSQVVEPLERLQVALQSQRGILPEPVEGRQKYPKLHPGRQCHLGCSSAPLRATDWAGF